MIDKFGLYVILTEPQVGYATCAQAAVDEGIRYCQLRMKDHPQKKILETAHQIHEITRHTDTLFIINDDVDIAMAVDADGVHVGQKDMPLTEVRQKWNDSDRVYGLSTHNENQEKAAHQLNPTYIGVGPVFLTPTKTIPDPVVGLERMGHIIQSSPLTTVAIGGINEDNLEDVLQYGAINFCAVRSITQSPKPQEVMRRMMKKWQSFQR